MLLVEFLGAQSDRDESHLSGSVTIGEVDGTYFSNLMESLESPSHEHGQCDSARDCVAHSLDDHLIVLVLEQSGDVGQVGSDVGCVSNTHLVVWALALLAMFISTFRFHVWLNII